MFDNNISKLDKAKIVIWAIAMIVLGIIWGVVYKTKIDVSTSDINIDCPNKAYLNVINLMHIIVIATILLFLSSDFMINGHSNIIQWFLVVLAALIYIAHSY